MYPTKAESILYFIHGDDSLFLKQVDLVTSGKGGVGPYVGICILVGAFGVADALVQGGMVGDLAFMLPEFMQVALQQILFCFCIYFNLRFLK